MTARRPGALALVALLGGCVGTPRVSGVPTIIYSSQSRPSGTCWETQLVTSSFMPPAQ